MFVLKMSSFYVCIHSLSMLSALQTRFFHGSKQHEPLSDPHLQGGTLIFSYIRRLGPFFGFKILNFNIFGGFQKNEYFWGIKI